MAEFDTNALKDEINNEVKLLNDMEAGSDEYKVTVEGVTKLTDRMIEIEKLELQKRQQHRAELHDMTEQAMKQTQLSHERKDRIITHVINIAGIAVPAILTVWGTFKTIEFEKEGTVTTIFGREYFKKLFYKK